MAGAPHAASASGTTGPSNAAETGDDEEDPQGSTSGPATGSESSGGPFNECASISQTTTIDERPVDIVLVGVGDVIDVPNYDIRWWLSDLPSHIEESGVDARLIAVLPGIPEDHMDGGDEGHYDCPGWDCGTGPVEIHDVVIADDRPLQGILDSAPQWTASLRPEARKHFLVWTERNTDSQTSASDFIADATALDGAFEGFVLHAFAWVEDPSFIPPDGAVREVATLTGGLYDDGSVRDVDTGFFEGVLTSIEESSLACEYEIPAPPEGLDFDPTRINVEYDEGAGLETIGYVARASDCAQTGPGWHYDDAANPTEIIMCPFSCQRFWAASHATIDIKFGCATIPAA
ncbi:MAG: hypothetical protein ACE37F_14860 [Nannocystaceae bacterium]|nr:hypothetical protein [bacterium]